MASKQSISFQAGAAFTDVPGTGLDQAIDTLGPDRNRWESIFWQVREVGKQGSLRWQVIASIDGVDWTTIAGVLINPTEGEAAEVDLNPGGLTQFWITNQDQPYLMIYRFYKIQVLSPSSNPNQQGVALVNIYAR